MAFIDWKVPQNKILKSENDSEFKVNQRMNAVNCEATSKERKRSRYGRLMWSVSKWPSSVTRPV